jgi:multiple sugar transport system permease protein
MAGVARRPRQRQPRVTRRQVRGWLSSGALHVALFFGAILVLLPFIWMVSVSFKPAGEFYAYSDRLLPVEPSLDAYRDIWTAIPFARLFANSVIFALGVSLLSLLLDSLAAYALARLHFRGRRISFWLVLIVLMVPFQITLIPLYLTVFEFGWIDSYAGLILPRATNAFGIFLLRQFFISIPRDYDEAARIDGASEFYIYRKIILPLSKPALATLFIFHFMYNWNDFLWPLVITTSQEMRTLPAGLALFMGQHTAEQALLLAGATLTLLPLLVAFLLAQRQFVRGVANTGIK